MALVFYDTETTGTETYFDQILQFAAIRTDGDLKELDRFEIRCLLSPYNVPSPGAMKVTGVSVATLNDPALPSHYEMMKTIRDKLVEWSPATFIGYNSIRFDEALLRQSFYKTLLPIYLTNTDGNSRSDVMRIVQAASFHTSDAIKIPVDDKGKNVFKLEHMAPANGFNHDKAHDALADVTATIHLSRLVADRAPELWSSFMRFSNRTAVTEFATETPVFSLSDFYFGLPYSWHVTMIGQNPDYAAELYVFNLEIDPTDLEGLSEEELVRCLNRSPKPVRRLLANGSPMIMPAEDAPDIAASIGLSDDELESRASYLSENEPFRERLVSAFEQTKTVYEKSPHVEKQIYDGFFNEDQVKLDKFHMVPWDERVSIVADFSDDRLRELGMRLIHAEHPEVLSDPVRTQYDLALAERLAGGDGEEPWLTLPKAIQQADDMLRVAQEDEKEFLREHRSYLASRLEACVEHLQ